MKAAPSKEAVSSASEAPVGTEASETIKTLRRRPPKHAVSTAPGRKKKPKAQLSPSSDITPAGGTSAGSKSEAGGPAWTSIGDEDGQDGAHEDVVGGGAGVGDFSFENPPERAIDTMSLEDLSKEVTLYLDRYKTWTVSEYLKSMNFDKEERLSVQSQDKVLRLEIRPAIQRVLDLVSSSSHDEMSHEELLDAHLALAKGCYKLWETADEFSEAPRIEKILPSVAEVLKRFAQDHEYDVVYPPDGAEVAGAAEATEGTAAGSDNVDKALMAPDEPAETAAEGDERTPLEAPSDSDVPPLVPGQIVNATATGVDGPHDAFVALAEAASAALDAAAKADGPLFSGNEKPVADPSAPIDEANATAAGTTANGSAPRRGGRTRAAESPGTEESGKKHKK